MIVRFLQYQNKTTKNLGRKKKPNIYVNQNVGPFIVIILVGYRAARDYCRCHIKRNNQQNAKSTEVCPKNRWILHNITYLMTHGCAISHRMPWKAFRVGEFLNCENNKHYEEDPYDSEISWEIDLAWHATLMHLRDKLLVTEDNGSQSLHVFLWIELVLFATGGWQKRHLLDRIGTFRYWRMSKKAPFG